MDNIDDPESFLRSLPPTRYYIAQELQRAGFRWDYDWNKSYEDEDDEDREPSPEEGAYYKSVHPPGWDGYRVSSVTIQSESGDDPDAATWYVAANNIEGQQVAVYQEHLPLAHAAKLAQELVVKLDAGQLEVVNNRLRPVDESMKLNEGKHKAGCQCGFCKNKGKFGKKADDADASKKDEKKPTAESIVRKLLDT